MVPHLRLNSIPLHHWHHTHTKDGSPFGALKLAASCPVSFPLCPVYDSVQVSGFNMSCLLIRCSPQGFSPGAFRS